MVPNGWERKRLSELCDKIAVGLAISVTPYMSSTGTKLIRNQNIKRNYFNTKSVVYINDDFAQANNSKRVYTGDVVAVRTGSNIGEACVVPPEFNEALTFTTLIARTSKKRLDANYLSAHINSEYGISEVKRLMAGGAKPNLNSGELKNYSLSTPPITEQRKIAKILSTWDKAISTTEKLIATSKQQEKALMQQLLKGKKRLLNPETGKVFKGAWEEVRLSDMFTRVTEKNKGQSDNVVTISAQNGLIRQEEFFKKSVASEILDDYFILRKGQFAYNKSYSNGYPMGAIKRLNRYEDGVVTSLYICFEISSEYTTSSCFMEQYFESGLLNRGLTKVAAEGGRAHGLLNVKPSDFMGLNIITPTFNEQQKIASVLTAADKEIELLQTKLAHLKQEKKALMQQLLTGKRRVSVEHREKITC
jgi:type I restriction enzyme S subunit